MHLRKTILSMALNIEHALKTQLLLDLSQNDSSQICMLVNDVTPTLQK